MSILTIEDNSKISLAEALLLRNALENKIKFLQKIKNAIPTFRYHREPLGDQESKNPKEEITALVPLTESEMVEKEENFYARRLRMLNQAIERVNWQTEVTEANFFKDYDSEDDLTITGTRTLMDCLVRRKELLKLAGNVVSGPDTSRLAEEVNEVVTIDTPLKAIKEGVDKKYTSDLYPEVQYYVGQLMRCEATIQKYNWLAKVEISKEIYDDFKPAD